MASILQHTAITLLLCRTHSRLTNYCCTFPFGAPSMDSAKTDSDLELSDADDRLPMVIQLRPS